MRRGGPFTHIDFTQLTLVLFLGRRYINFGALCLQLLDVSKLYAKLTDPASVAKYDVSISVIEVLMGVLTYGLFLSFGGVAFKKTFLALKHTNIAELRSKAASATPKVLRGMLCPSSGGADADSDDGNPAHEFVANNPMRDADSAGDIEMRGTATLSVNTKAPTTDDLGAGSSISDNGGA